MVARIAFRSPDRLRPLSRRVALALVLLVAGVSAAWGHEVRPAMLRILESHPGAYQAVWKQPMVGDMAVHLAPKLSSGSLDRQPDQETAAPGFLIKAWTVRGGAPLDGQSVTIEGLPQSVTDVVVHVEGANGVTRDLLLRPASANAVLDLHPPRGVAVPGYLVLGVEHILTGIDHLLFVLGLLLLVGPGRRIIEVVSAFTIAHSITLALAALGYIHFPSAVIEALVALSIVFVAVELVPRPGRPLSLTQRNPWLIAFTFGLLHGMAFAGALAEIGLPPGAAPMALFLFNVGVEIGQLSFIAAAVTAILALRWARGRAPKALGGFSLDAAARLAPPYAIGGLACWWMFERIGVILA